MLESIFGVLFLVLLVGGTLTFAAHNEPGLVTRLVHGAGQLTAAVVVLWLVNLVAVPLFGIGTRGGFAASEFLGPEGVLLVAVAAISLSNPDGVERFFKNVAFRVFGSAPAPAREYPPEELSASRVARPSPAAERPKPHVHCGRCGAQIEREYAQVRDGKYVCFSHVVADNDPGLAALVQAREPLPPEAFRRSDGAPGVQPG